MKPVFASDDSKAIDAAQATLYRALDVGLRLLSPFMPFITEELYQRLPRPQGVKNSFASIGVAPYPEVEEYSWRNEKIDAEVDLVQKIAKAIRSARSDYNLPNKTKTEGKRQLLTFFFYDTASIRQ